MKKHFQKIKKPVFSHDRFFKDSFSKPKMARELLKFIFSKKEVQAYDIKKIKVEKDSFKDNLQADLILSVPFKTKPKLRARVFILLEHKSHYDKALFSQVLDYLILLRKWIINQTGHPQLIIPVLFYHGSQTMTWENSLLEDDFKNFFNKIPIETRKDMLNFQLRVINTKEQKVRKFFKSKSFKCWGFIKLLDEIWNIKNPDTKKVNLIINDYFGRLLKDTTKKEAREITLRVIRYLQEAGGLRTEIWKTAEKQLIKDGILTEGGYMNIIDHIKEEGRWEGERKGIQKGLQTVILNMLKKKTDISFISEVTGVPVKEIKKIKKTAESAF